MQSNFSGESIRLWFDSLLHWLLTTVFTAENVVYAAMQMPAISGAGFAAWWVHDFVAPLVADRIRSQSQGHLQSVLLTLASLIFPLLWAVNLWTAVLVARYFRWPHDMVWIAINLLLAWIVIRLAAILVRDPIWSRIIAIVAYAVADLNILHLLQPTLEVLDRMAIRIGTLRLSALTVLEGMLSLGILLWVAFLISEILERRVQRLPNLTPSARVLFGKLLKATLVLLAIVISLTNVGIDLSAIALFSGAVGLGLGFGLQRVVSNLISGIILLMDRSIKPGDIIQIGDTYGWIASLGARYVSVETRDGTEFLIPNEDIITHQVINWSHRNDLARIKVRVRIAYECDVRRALSLMIEAARRQTARVLDRPAPTALLLGFGESALELELRFWIRDVQNGIRNISSEVMLEIWDLFRAHGIKVPYPQRDVHMHPAAPDVMPERPEPGQRPPSEPPPLPAASPRTVNG